MCQHNGICRDESLAFIIHEVRSPSEELRRHFLARDESDYRIALDTGLHRDTLKRLRDGRPISLRAFDVLAHYLGLELRPVSRRRSTGLGTK